jgi:hypothetical protein
MIFKEKKISLDHGSKRSKKARYSFKEQFQTIPCCNDLGRKTVIMFVSRSNAQIRVANMRKPVQQTQKDNCIPGR